MCKFHRSPSPSTRCVLMELAKQIRFQLIDDTTIALKKKIYKSSKWKHAKRLKCWWDIEFHHRLYALSVTSERGDGNFKWRSNSMENRWDPWPALRWAIDVAARKKKQTHNNFVRRFSQSESSNIHDREIIILITDRRTERVSEQCTELSSYTIKRVVIINIQFLRVDCFAALSTPRATPYWPNILLSRIKVAERLASERTIYMAD